MRCQAMQNKLLEYLNARGLEIIKRDKPLEITETEEMLTDVAGVWISGKEAIRLVIQARCDKLREKLICTDMPFETPITRQVLVELGGILEDFENIHAEFINRDKAKKDVIET